MKYIKTIAALCFASVLLSGCSEQKPNVHNFAHLRLQAVSTGQAFEAATIALRERFQIDNSDPESLTITTVPQETTEVLARGRVGDLVGVPRRVRKLAYVHVTGSNSETSIWCKVAIQQDETGDRSIHQSDRSLDDIPRSTPADGSGATTQEQNELWTTTRRDKRAERAILQSINEILAKHAASKESK